MPGKKNSGADSESPAKKMKGETSLWSDLAAERLNTAENITAFNKGKPGAKILSYLRDIPSLRYLGQLGFFRTFNQDLKYTC